MFSLLSHTKVPLVLAHAFAANALFALALSVATDVGVLGREGVTAIAMCLSSVLRRECLAADPVDVIRYRLEVARIEARAIPAAVVGLEAGGNRADEALVCYLVRLPTLVADAHATVSLRIDVAFPRPALIGADVTHERESFLEREPVAIRTAFLAALSHARNLTSGAAS